MVLEVIAHAKVREGRLEGLKAQAAEIVRVTREKDTRTLRCDWFLNDEATECEVHELFPDEQGLMEHQMHITDARTVLFRDFASDHASALYGDVSQDFLSLISGRTGAAPPVFTFFQGLDPAARTASGSAGNLEVQARLRIRPGQLEGFKNQAAEIMRLTRELDAHTVRYDWFLSEDGTACEVHEAYLSGQGLIEHNAHVMEARAVLFERYAYDHRMSAFGEVSADLKALAHEHAGGLAAYSFVEGFRAAAPV
jgi:quinol monooxygenase YgiN